MTPAVRSKMNKQNKKAALNAVALMILRGRRGSMIAAKIRASKMTIVTIIS
jgi:hypothetical protein